MAWVSIADIIENLDSDIKPALEKAVRNVFGDVSFDGATLFREFCGELRRQCPGSVYIPNLHVKAD